MRRKVKKLLVTFQGTTKAMRAEEVFSQAGMRERLIPVPGSITAGCGLCWKGECSDREQLKRLLEENQIHYEQFVEIELWEFD